VEQISFYWNFALFYVELPSMIFHFLLETIYYQVKTIQSLFFTAFPYVGQGNWQCWHLSLLSDLKKLD